MNRVDSLHTAPAALYRSGLALADLLALPILSLGSLVVLGAALASLGVAAGGVNFVLGLPYLDFFPVFPPIARILSGLSLLAFSALLIVSMLLLWRLFRAVWKHFWSWHRSAWQGAEARLFVISAVSGRAKGFAPLVKVSGLVFLALLTVSFVLMMLLARGPFWHAWRWFS